MHIYHQADSEYTTSYFELFFYPNSQMRVFCKKVNKVFPVSTSPELVFLLFFFFFPPESLQARMVLTLAALYPLARKKFETRKVKL